MTTARLRSRRIAAGLVVLGLTLYVWPLTLDAPLTDPDEGLHAAIAQEMVERGDWNVPRLLGEPFRDKPILYFWALAASLEVVGMTETAVRLPGLLFGLLGSLTTAWLAGALAGRRAAAIAGALYATTLLPLAIAQAGVHDVALVPWTNLALLGLWYAAARPGAGRRTVLAVATGACVGLAILTKGLVGVALVGMPFAIWLVFERRLTAGLVAAGALTVLVGVAVAWPWYHAMEAADPGYLRYYFLDRHIMGFATATQVHGQRPWWYYLPIVAGGALPWILGVPLATPGRLGRQWHAGTRLAWIWLLVDVAILSVAKSKLVTYVLPAFPAAAILAAIAWDGWLEPDARPARPGWFAAYVVTLSALVPAAVIVAAARFGIGPSVVTGVGAVLVPVAASMAWVRWRAGAARRALGWLLASTATFFVTVMAGLFPAIAAEVSSRDLARALVARGALPPRLWLVDERVGSVVFYLESWQRRDLEPGRIENLGYGAVLTRLALAPADVLIAVAARDAGRLVRGPAADTVPYVTAGRYRLYTVGDLRAGLLEREGEWGSEK